MWYTHKLSMVEGSLEVKLPTIWTDEKQRWQESEKRGEEERRSKRRKSQKKEDPGARKGRKVAKRCVFPMICGSGGSKSRLAKAAGAEPAGQVRDEKLHAVVERSTVPTQNVQSTPTLTTFGSCDVEKVHAVVARSTFRSQKCKKLTGSEHFWKLRCRKSARRCGAKHISKSKVQNIEGYWALLDVQMSFCVAGARDYASCQKWAKREGFVAFQKSMAGVGHLKRICKDAFSVSGAVQETCSSELLGGPGADFLRGLHFGASDLQVCWDDFAWQVQHFVWPGITFSWQAQ